MSLHIVGRGAGETFEIPAVFNLSLREFRSLKVYCLKRHLDLSRGVEVPYAGLSLFCEPNEVAQVVTWYSLFETSCKAATLGYVSTVFF